MKICVIGNSHVACLKEAWDQLEPLHPGIEVRFFASPAAGLFSLELHDGCLKPSDPKAVKDIMVTSGGLEAIQLDNFDAFLVHGLNLMVPVLQKHLSQAVVHQCVAEMAEASFNLKVCRMILQHARKPVYSGHTPMRARASNASTIAYDKISEVMKAFLANEGIILLTQPEQTIATPLGTKEVYTRGSRKLDFVDPEGAMHDDGEIMHMNAAFGVLMFEKYLSALGVVPAVSVAQR